MVLNTKHLFVIISQLWCLEETVKTLTINIAESVLAAAASPPSTPLSSAALVGFESNNKYEVRNSLGQNVFYAVEENDCLNRQCCGPMRPFTIHVLDNFGQEVITVTRPLKCMSCFFPCCLQEVSKRKKKKNLNAMQSFFQTSIK